MIRSCHLQRTIPPEPPEGRGWPHPQLDGVQQSYVRIRAGIPDDDLKLHERIQARPIEQFMRKRGWKRLPVYRDVASAKAGKRWPRLHALMTAARRGEVDVVISFAARPDCQEHEGSLSGPCGIEEAGCRFRLARRWLRHDPPTRSCIVRRGHDSNRNGAWPQK